MKILLLGEYSSLHWTLAQGLKELGNDVTVASDGDGFKNYPRNIDLLRKSSSIGDTLSAIAKVVKNLKNFKGYDIVQLINPCFTTLNVEINRYIYRYLRSNNDKVFLGAFGDDSYWLKACLDNSTYKYSEFFVDGKENHLSDNDLLKAKWLGTARESLNKEIADTCDGIIACLCEYYLAYKKTYGEKLSYIPLPINVSEIRQTNVLTSDKLKFFIGINTVRSEFKGTDRLYNVLLNIQEKYDKEVSINKAESLPYREYVKLVEESDVVLDQLYSYSPAMNGLLTMAMGKVLVGGGEPEIYDLLNETENRPIINVFPSEEDVFNKLESLVLNKSLIEDISSKSRLFVEKHHDYKKVAQQYLDFWSK